MSPECGESGGEVSDSGEGEGMSQDAEQVAKKLGDSLPGLPTRHNAARHVFRACVVVTQLTIENGEPLFEVEYEY